MSKIKTLVAGTILFFSVNTILLLYARERRKNRNNKMSKEI